MSKLTLETLIERKNLKMDGKAFSKEYREMLNEDDIIIISLNEQKFTWASEEEILEIMENKGFQISMEYITDEFDNVIVGYYWSKKDNVEHRCRFACDMKKTALNDFFLNNPLYFPIVTDL